MLIASLVFALFSQNAHAATSCRIALESKIEPRISTLKVENKDNYYVGTNLVQIKTPQKDKAIFAVNGQFGMSIVTVDLKDKTVQTSRELGDLFLRSSGYQRMAVSADGKAIAYSDGSNVTILEPTKKGFKKVAKADFSHWETHWNPWQPHFYVHNDQTFQLAWGTTAHHADKSYGVAIGRGKSTVDFTSVTKTVGEYPDLVTDGYKNYSYDSQKRHLDVLDVVTGEKTTHKFKAESNLRFDEFNIKNAEKLEDGSVLLTGYKGWIRLDANLKLVNQDSYRDSFDQDSQAILWNIDKTSDRQGNKFAIPTEKLNFRNENQAVQVIDTVTGGVKTISVPDVKRVFLNKDGSMVFETGHEIKVLDQNGKEIKSFKLPTDGYYPQQGDLSRINDRAFVFTSSMGKNLLIEL